jgi:serine/threonine protein kinase
MLDENGQIRIVDFGAAHQFMEGVTGTLIGKQCYIAPEQLRGKANTQSDIYSFGCTLYFLLTGKDPRALSQSDLSDTDRKISPRMQELVKVCTDIEDAKRPASFDEILSTLESVNTTTSKRSDDKLLLPSVNAFYKKLRELSMQYE